MVFLDIVVSQIFYRTGYATVALDRYCTPVQNDRYSEKNCAIISAVERDMYTVCLDELSYEL